MARRGYKPGRPVPASEAELQRQLVELAQELGWVAFHTWAPVRSSGPGFPDLVLRHDSRAPYIVALEIKTRAGVIRPGQQEWIRAFQRSGVPAMILRLPDEWETAVQLLTGEGV